MNQDDIIRAVAGLVVTASVSYVLARSVSKKTAALVAPLVLGVAHQQITPRVAQTMRQLLD